MGDTDFHDPHDILPESFKQRYADCDSVDDALQKVERSPGTTADDTKPRCDALGCGTTRLRPKPGHRAIPHKIDSQYVCSNGHHVTDTRPPLEECPVEYAWKWLNDQQRYRDMQTKTMPINTPFDWCTDLEDPDERGMSPLFGDLDEETRVELAIRLYRPWTDAGPSYRELAELFPHGRAWIGERVRDWKGGEHRELVEQPGPTVDAPGDDAIAVATDGGRRRRWAAYGSD